MTPSLSNAWAALFNLPSFVKAAVSFDLDQLKQLATHEQVMSMCNLPPDIELQHFCSIALTTQGWLLLRRDGTCITSSSYLTQTTDSSLGYLYYQRFHSLHRHSGSLSVGVGSYGNLPAVSLVIDLVENTAFGEAITARNVKPSDILLLPSVGVRLISQETLNRRTHRIVFSNRVQTHLDSADLNSYQRTGHCNLFFLRHCLVDSQISSGLIKAAERRREAVYGRLSSKLVSICLSDSLSSFNFRTLCNLPSKTEKVGNTVYIAFLASALRSISNCKSILTGNTVQQADLAYSILLSLLEEHRISGLWGFQPDYIPTSVDSAFVSLSGLLPEWDSLSLFSASGYGYYPQQYEQSGSQTPYAMSFSDHTKHWHYIDLPTTVFLESLRLESGLTSSISETWIADRFDLRLGLFIANDILALYMISSILPYLQEPVRLKKRIYDQLCSYRRPDGSFSCDQTPSALSNALAALVLMQLGFNDNWVSSAQMHAVLAYEDGFEYEPFFCSTIRIPEVHYNSLSRMRHRSSRIRKIGNSYFSLTLYCDYLGYAVLSILVKALSINSRPEIRHSTKDIFLSPESIQSDCNNAAQTIEDLCFMSLESHIS